MVISDIAHAKRQVESSLAFTVGMDANGHIVPVSAMHIFLPESTETWTDFVAEHGDGLAIGELHTNGEYLDIIVLVAEQCGCSLRTAMDSLAANEDDIIEAIMALNVAEADDRDPEVKLLGG
jgi:hypothetical protein